MATVGTFFRTCPSCGRRFHVTLVDTKLIDERKSAETVKVGAAAPVGPANRGSLVVLEQDVPVTIDIRDFRYSYRCKHCGHVWAELHERKSKG